MLNFAKRRSFVLNELPQHHRTGVMGLMLVIVIALITDIGLVFIISLPWQAWVAYVIQMGVFFLLLEILTNRDKHIKRFGSGDLLRQEADK